MKKDYWEWTCPYEENATGRESLEKLKEIADLHLSEGLNALQTRGAMEKLH